jgi:hypothetical protein
VKGDKMYVEYDVKKLKDELTVEDINKIVGELGGELRVEENKMSNYVKKCHSNKYKVVIYYVKNRLF